MFTGIIEQTGTVKKRDKNALAISVGKSFISHLKQGSSISVNGVCLTVKTLSKPDIFSADVMSETWKRTMLGTLKEGMVVNLELPMRANSSFDGHFVQGHVDDTARLVEIRKHSGSHLLVFNARREITKFLVEKGSVAINGISLTIINAEKNTFTVGIIPHTWERTMLQYLKKGDLVNIEVDILAKYIEKLITRAKKI